MERMSSYKKSVFAMLILLSTPSIGYIMVKTEVSDFKRVLLVGLNLIFLFLISEYIEQYIYRKIIKKVFAGRCFMYRTVCKLHFIAVPIWSLLIYTGSWLLLMYDSFEYIQTVGLLLIMSSALMIFPVELGNKVIHANKDHIFLAGKILPIASIRSYDYCTKRVIGLEVSDFKIVTDNGEGHILSISKNHIDDFCGLLNR